MRRDVRLKTRLQRLERFGTIAVVFHDQQQQQQVFAKLEYILIVLVVVECILLDF